jgi:signal transduction histidine kinase
MNILLPLYTGNYASIGLQPEALAFYQSLERRDLDDCLDRIRSIYVSNEAHTRVLQSILRYVVTLRIRGKGDIEEFVGTLPVPFDAPVLLKAHASLVLIDHYRTKGHIDEAISHAEESLRLFTEESRPLEQAMVHHRLAMIHLTNGHEFLHNQHILTAVDLLGEFPDHPFYPRVIGVAAAAILGNRALDAIELITKAIESSKRVNDVPSQYALLQSVILAYKKAGLFDQAESLVDELIRLAEMTGNINNIVRARLSKVDVLHRRNDPQVADILNDDLKSMAMQSDPGAKCTYLSACWHDSLRSDNPERSHVIFKEFYSNVKATKRADWLIVALKERLEYQEHQLSDSERAETYRELAELIETRYDAQTATLPTLFTSYKRQLDARHELQRIQHQEQVAMSIQVRDMVIDEIAQVLHDDLGQRIATTRLHAERLARQFQGHADQAQAYNDVSIGLVEIGDSVRKLSQTLSTKSVSDLGLFKAFHLMTDSIAAGGTVTVFAHTIGPEESIPFTIARTTYRIAQSLLQNALKHSRCSSIEAQIIVSDGVLQLTVGDDGTGFDPDAPRSVTGLRDVEMRVSSADGTMTIDTAPGRGTFVTISIPLEKT